MGPGDRTPSSESGVSTAQANPSVSKAQWERHALRKLRDGYVLLQSPNGRTFNFCRSGDPMQPCASHAARRLIEIGLLTVMKTDVRGTHYAVPDAFRENAPSA